MQEPREPGAEFGNPPQPQAALALPGCGKARERRVGVGDIEDELAGFRHGYAKDDAALVRCSEGKAVAEPVVDEAADYPDGVKNRTGPAERGKAAPNPPPAHLHGALLARQLGLEADGDRRRTLGALKIHVEFLDGRLHRAQEWRQRAVDQAGLSGRSTEQLPRTLGDFVDLPHRNVEVFDDVLLQCPAAGQSLDVAENVRGKPTRVLRVMSVKEVMHPDTEDEFRLPPLLTKAGSTELPCCPRPDCSQAAPGCGQPLLVQLGGDLPASVPECGECQGAML